jgi:hypothetical protein
MSTKRYCDVCDTEINRNYVSSRYRLKRGAFTAEIMLKRDSTWNTGEICLPCLRELLTKGREVKE